MKVIQANNYEDMSRQAANYLIKKVQANPALVLGLATGGTPTGTYQQLVRDHQENGTSYQQVQSINLDEYVGLAHHHPKSYHTFMNKHLFQHLDIPKENNHIPHGLATDLTEECHRYDQLIQHFNGVDIQLLGIGENGHIGFNEPGTSFHSHTHIVKLTHSTRKANARFFNHLHEVPEQAITMGIQSILTSKEILLLASGKNKAMAIKELFHGTMDEKFPASALHYHSNVTIIADKDALSLVGQAERRKMDG